MHGIASCVGHVHSELHISARMAPIIVLLACISSLSRLLSVFFKLICCSSSHNHKIRKMVQSLQRCNAAGLARRHCWYDCLKIFTSKWIGCMTGLGRKPQVLEPFFSPLMPKNPTVIRFHHTYAVFPVRAGEINPISTPIEQEQICILS